MKKKKNLLPGSLIKIRINEHYQTFSRVLNNNQIAIYNLTKKLDEAINIDEIYNSDIICKLTIMTADLNSGRWPVVGWKELDENLKKPIYYYIRDPISGSYSTYRSSDGTITKSTYEDCKYLEVAAVWDAAQIEDRIHNFFSAQ